MSKASGEVDKIRNEALVARAGVAKQSLADDAQAAADRAKLRYEKVRAERVRIREEKASGEFSEDHARIPEVMEEIASLERQINERQERSNTRISTFEKSYNTFNVGPLYAFTKEYGIFPRVGVLNFIPNVIGRVLTSIPFAVFRAFEYPIGYAIKSRQIGFEKRSTQHIIKAWQDKLDPLKIKRDRLELGSDAPDISGLRFQTNNETMNRGPVTKIGKRLADLGGTGNQNVADEFVRKMKAESSMVDKDKVFPTGMFGYEITAFYNCAFGRGKSPIVFSQLTPDQWMKTWDALTAIPGEFEKAGHGKFSADKAEAKKMMMQEVARLIAEGIWPIGAFKKPELVNGVRPPEMDGDIPAKLAEFPELMEAVAQQIKHVKVHGKAVIEEEEPKLDKATEKEIKAIAGDEKEKNDAIGAVLKEKQAAEKRAARAEAKLAEVQKSSKAPDVNPMQTAMMLNPGMMGFPQMVPFMMSPQMMVPGFQFPGMSNIGQGYAQAYQNFQPGMVNGAAMMQIPAAEALSKAATVPELTEDEKDNALADKELTIANAKNKRKEWEAENNRLNAVPLNALINTGGTATSLAPAAAPITSGGTTKVVSSGGSPLTGSRVPPAIIPTTAAIDAAKVLEARAKAASYAAACVIDPAGYTKYITNPGKASGNIEKAASAAAVAAYKAVKDAKSDADIVVDITVAFNTALGTTAITSTLLPSAASDKNKIVEAASSLAVAASGATKEYFDSATPPYKFKEFNDKSATKIKALTYTTGGSIFDDAQSKTIAGIAHSGVSASGVVFGAAVPVRTTAVAAVSSDLETSGGVPITVAPSLLPAKTTSPSLESYSADQIEFAWAKHRYNEAMIAFNRSPLTGMTIKKVDPQGTMQVVKEMPQIVMNEAKATMDRLSSKLYRLEAERDRLEKLAEYVQRPEFSKAVAKSSKKATGKDGEALEDDADAILNRVRDAWEAVRTVSALEQAVSDDEYVEIARKELKEAFSQLTPDDITEMFSKDYGHAWEDKVEGFEPLQLRGVMIPEHLRIGSERSKGLNTPLNFDECRAVAIKQLSTFGHLEAAKEAIKKSGYVDENNKSSPVNKALKAQAIVITEREEESIEANREQEIEKRNNLSWSSETDSAVFKLNDEISLVKYRSYGGTEKKGMFERSPLIRFMREGTRQTTRSDITDRVIELTRKERDALVEKLGAFGERIDTLEKKIREGIDGKPKDYLPLHPGEKDFVGALIATHVFGKVRSEEEVLKYNASKAKLIGATKPIDIFDENGAKEAWAIRDGLRNITDKEVLEVINNNPDFRTVGVSDEAQRNAGARLNNFLQLIPISAQQNLLDAHFKRPLLGKAQEAVLLRSVNNAVGIVQTYIADNLAEAKQNITRIQFDLKEMSKPAASMFSRLKNMSVSASKVSLEVPQSVQTMLKEGVAQKMEDAMFKSDSFKIAIKGGHNVN